MQPDLHDIVLPEPVSWTPQTAGWWILLALAAALAAWASYRLVRSWRANRYRRAARVRLDSLAATLTEPEARQRALAELPVLVKQTALAFRPRAEVAALSGEPWLRFLDESYGGHGFTRGPGRLLPTLAYARPGEVAGEELEALIGLVRRWIGRHHVRA